MLRRFYGGVRPNDKKSATRREASIPLPLPPEQVVLPMVMHVGAPCTPVVAADDRVQIGQLVGTPTGRGAAIHASVSGKVAAVEPRPHPDGGQVLSVVIDNDGQNTRAPALPRLSVYTMLAPDEIIARIEQAGMVGLGGEAVPTHEKLRDAAGRVDTLLINATECEPYCTADHRLMLERPEECLTGTRILMRALGLKRAIIAVLGNKTNAITALNALLPLRGGDVTVKSLGVRYPQGAERQLIQRVTGRSVPPGGRAADVKCAVFNVATAAAVRAAVAEGVPLTERIVTVTGNGVASPQNFIVPVGTPISHLLTAAGGLTMGRVRVITGGPMAGLAQADLQVPVLKGTAAVLALRRPFSAAEDGTCIRCGGCITVCPMRLMPVELYRLHRAARYADLAAYHPEDCIACGACAFGCPARLPLTQSIRDGTAQLHALQAQDAERGDEN